MEMLSKLDSKYKIDTDNREKLFEKLVDSIENCRLCPEMECRAKVLSENNGNIYSNVLFVAEAPGRLGADRTMIPLFGDQSGVNFQKLIDTIGWTREDFFITNAVLCNPRDEKGNNATPSKELLRNCSIYLEILISIMQPEYIITLGQKALESLRTLYDIDISLKRDVRKMLNWNGYNLIPLYHTSPRAMMHRNFYNQLADFYWIHNNVKIKAKTWEKLKEVQLKKRVSKVDSIQTKLQKLVLEILGQTNQLTEFKLTKLLYLIDYNSLRERGKLVTNSYYIRSYNGPIPVGLDKQLEQLYHQGMVSKKGKLVYLKSKDVDNTFKSDEREIINKVLNTYTFKSDEEIKTSAYLTAPMKRILRAEKKDNSSMLHKPVFSEEDFIKL
ncbi:MAG: hypothetical protein K0R93_681 [Anaerosolibacter sp.]|jgi:uracil-DNA glycosylase family 4|uniref:uracil-DNA glycosylase family protein n=1 Tax=Anaerosolibacter sp. TaxID=1872527 RepID=UPI00260C15DB|nr:uracil-DNA glycosylase family protein [Anaerosolibacter sp.]MDF2545783.1 hypothetical protein [Anaerosolibacter sp.]